MADHTITLNATSSTPDPLTVASGDKVTFHNAMTEATTVSFSSPSPFSPTPGDVPIDAGGDSAQLNANSSGGTYTYTIPSVKRGTRSGTIQV